MQKRIRDELIHLKETYPNIAYEENGQWVKIPNYPIPPGWNQDRIDVVYQIPQGYPGTPPYGIYVQKGLRYQGKMPNNYVEPAKAQPPYIGIWGILSWQPVNWFPMSNLKAGSNLWSWIKGFSVRFKEGA